MFRTLVPYPTFLDKLYRKFADTENTLINFHVRKISWEPRLVKVMGQLRGRDQFKEFQARKIVVTVPAGVLAKGHLNIDPYPSEIKTFLDSVEMGHVQRIGFRFKDRFWEGLHEKPISFLHFGSENYFPTWWTLQPLRVPHLIAWQGGPRAESLSRMPFDERVEKAIGTLSRLTHRSKRFLYAQIEQTFHHDWSHDPFSLGAYSYIKVDGIHKWGVAKNIQNTIYMAGEAFSKGAGRGTVHGAYVTGIRAAHSILQSMKKSGRSALRKSNMTKSLLQY